MIRRLFFKNNFQTKRTHFIFIIHNFEFQETKWNLSSNSQLQKWKQKIKFENKNQETHNQEFTTIYTQ